MDANQPPSPAPVGATAAALRALYVGERAASVRIKREVYGDEYPEKVAPNSSVTNSELRCLARDLGVGPGRRVVDLACGAGGVALCLARRPAPT